MKTTAFKVISVSTFSWLQIPLSIIIRVIPVKNRSKVTAWFKTHLYDKRKRKEKYPLIASCCFQGNAPNSYHDLQGRLRPGPYITFQLHLWTSSAQHLMVQASQQIFFFFLLEYDVCSQYGAFIHKLFLWPSTFLSILFRWVSAWGPCLSSSPCERCSITLCYLCEG